MNRPSLLRAFGTLGRRRIQHSKTLSLLILAGVTVGVAMVTAIDLASGSALTSLRYSTQTLQGQTTHILTGAPQTIPWSVYVDLRVQARIRDSAPVVTDRVRIADREGASYSLLGLDPLSETSFRPFLVSGSVQALGSEAALRFMSEPFTLLMTEDAARSLGLSPGDEVSLEYQDRVRTFTLLDYIEQSDAYRDSTLNQVLITDIANAQIFLDRTDALDRIDLILPEPGAEAALTRIQALLPPSVRLEPVDRQVDAVRELTRSFRLNLSALSLLAVVVGTFLIYNTLSFHVTRESRVLGTLRALGFQRRHLFLLIMAEALVMGLAGSGLGLVMGWYLAQRLVSLVAQSYGDLYFIEAVGQVIGTPAVFLKGALIGIGCALLGAGKPALSASRADITRVLRDLAIEREFATPTGRFTVLGGMLAGLGGFLLLPMFPLEITFAGILAGLVGMAFLVPALLRLGSRQTLNWVGSRRWPFVKMALRQPLRRLGQSSVAVAALMMSLSVIIGVGTMVGSFRLSVVDWLEQIVQADIYLSVTDHAPRHLLTDLGADHFTALPGVTQVESTHTTEQYAPDLGAVRLIAFSDDMAKHTRRFSSQMPHATNIWDDAVTRGAVLINDPMAHQFDLTAGDTLRLATDRNGIQSFTIAGVAVAYDAVPVILMDDGVYRQHWESPGITSLALTLETEADPALTLQALDRRFNQERDNLLIVSNRELRARALVLFDQTFAITGALQILAMLVSFMSVLATLMSMMLDQARELATMRALGATKKEIGRLLFMEAMVFGLFAVVLAIPLGILLSIILTYIINARSFGWSLGWTLQPAEVMKAIGVALTSAALAGAYPIYRLGTQPFVRHLRTE